MMEAIADLRYEKDLFFAQDPHSPLTAAQKANFEGLDYFPFNPDLKFEVAVQRIFDQQPVMIQTSTGDFQEYQRYGKFQFAVDGEPVTLTIFSNQHGFFLPFVDSLAGKETYPAGRYLEPELLADGKFLIDFNQAYNPYCAYNEHWSCPLTPFENRIMAPIRAGEKIFHE